MRSCIEPMSRDGARWRRRTLVGIALAMLLWVGFGRTLVSLLRPSGDVPQDAFGAVTRRVTGPSGAELAIEESGPQDAPRIVLTHGWVRTVANGPTLVVGWKTGFE
jgi:hypothetical protein